MVWVCEVEGSCEEELLIGVIAIYSKYLFRNSLIISNKKKVELISPLALRYLPSIERVDLWFRESSSHLSFSRFIMVNSTLISINNKD